MKPATSGLAALSVEDDTSSQKPEEELSFPEDYGSDAVAETMLSALDYRSAATAATTCRLFRRAFDNPAVFMCVAFGVWGKAHHPPTTCLQHATRCIPAPPPPPPIKHFSSRFLRTSAPAQGVAPPGSDLARREAHAWIWARSMCYVSPPSGIARATRLPPGNAAYRPLTFS
jgi:hypothetical protein